jgi:hypothetical protein
MRAIVLGAALLALAAVPAGAFECPALQAQIDKEFGKRFDARAAGAREKAAQAAALHKAGKHAESVKMYDEAAKAGGLKLAHKQK